MSINPPLNYYVYYKLDPATQSEVEPLIYSLLSRMTCRTGIPARLMQKADGSHTWMEVYEGVTDRRSFEAALTELCDRYDLDMLLDRHAEIFESVFESLHQTDKCAVNDQP